MEGHATASATTNLLSIARVLRELADRIESVAIAIPDAATEASPFIHPLVIDPGTLSIRWGGYECVLGASIGFRLMQRLARRPNHYMSHDHLLDDVWGCRRSASTVRSAVRDLRQKLSDAGMADLAARIDGSHRGHYALLLD